MKKKNKRKLRHARCTYYRFHGKSLAREKNDFNKNENYKEQIFDCRTNTSWSRFYQILNIRMETKTMSWACFDLDVIYILCRCINNLPVNEN